MPPRSPTRRRSGREPAPGDERLLAGEQRRLIVFGHSHRQFRRPGPSQTELVNPGSVGLPLDGDRRAAWALRTPDGAIELRRTEYDAAPSIERLREIGSEWADAVALMLEHAEEPDQAASDSSTSDPRCSPIAWTSVHFTTPSLPIRKVPRTDTPRVSSKTP